jgi:1-acyl-sn-glycerol-3-phosphate acyltransferase
MERIAYRIADFYNQKLRVFARIWNRTFMLVLLTLLGGRRIKGYCVDRVAHITNEDRVVMVANHRSFFDFFVILWINFTRTRISSRILFPVRSTFFYTRPLGVLINFALSGMAMFPPVLREPARREFNRFSLDRVIDELSRPSTVVGFHPEGRRNKNDDFHELLTAKPGVGEVALRTSPDVKFVPIFVVGMGNNLALEGWRTWFRARAFPIDIVYGEPIDFSDLRNRPHTPELYQEAADRCMDAIADLGEYQRRHGRLKPRQRRRLLRLFGA